MVNICMSFVCTWGWGGGGEERLELEWNHAQTYLFKGFLRGGGDIQINEG